MQRVNDRRKLLHQIDNRKMSLIVKGESFNKSERKSDLGEGKRNGVKILIPWRIERKEGVKGRK